VNCSDAQASALLVGRARCIRLACTWPQSLRSSASIGLTYDEPNGRRHWNSDFALPSARESPYIHPCGGGSGAGRPAVIVVVLILIVVHSTGLRASAAQVLPVHFASESALELTQQPVVTEVLNDGTALVSVTAVTASVSATAKPNAPATAVDADLDFGQGFDASLPQVFLPSAVLRIRLTLPNDAPLPAGETEMT
jgi:hypothetical protein